MATATTTTTRNPPSGGSGKLDPSTGFNKLTTSAFIGRFLTEQKPNWRSVTFIPVESVPGLEGAGVYVAIMSGAQPLPPALPDHLFLRQRPGLHVRQYAGQGADASSTQLTSGSCGRRRDPVAGRPRAGAARAETDGDGRAVFAENARSDARVVVARKGELLSSSPQRAGLDLAEFDIGGPHIGAGAPFCLLRPQPLSPRREVRSFPSWPTMPTAARCRPPVQAILRRPDGKGQWTATWAPEEQSAGYYKRPIELPADAATGFWNSNCAPTRRQGGQHGMRIGVEEFLPERMKLDLGTEADGWCRYRVADRHHGNSSLRRARRRQQAAGRGTPSATRIRWRRNCLASSSAMPTKIPSAPAANWRSPTPDDQGKGQRQRRPGVGAEAPSPFTVRATLSLSSGGCPVVRSIERNVPSRRRCWWDLRPMFVGAYAREGSNAEFEVAVADTAANLKAGTALRCVSSGENRDWYWRFDDRRGWHSGYSETDELVATTRVSVPAGGRAAAARAGQTVATVSKSSTLETNLATRYRFYAGWSAKDDETQGVRLTGSP